jgi:hypothetical protein
LSTLKVKLTPSPFRYEVPPATKNTTVKPEEKKQTGTGDEGVGGQKKNSPDSKTEDTGTDGGLTKIDDGGIVKPEDKGKGKDGTDKTDGGLTKIDDGGIVKPEDKGTTDTGVDDTPDSGGHAHHRFGKKGKCK